MGHPNRLSLAATLVALLCLLGFTFGEEVPSDRSGKLFPLFSIVRIHNQPCNPESGTQMGTCFTNSQCRSAGGVTSGTCASGFGVCCIVSATCDSVITQNNTNFRNRDGPGAFTPNGLELCNVRIQRPTNRNICQIRLDFITMDLAAPDAQGQCMADRLSINGVSSQTPSNLCGSLTGQHMYLDYGSSDRITLSVITDGAGDSKTREWNVKVTYIECNSLLRAPDGCLQYYTQTTGQVKMLGYPNAPHLADLDYTVCVRSEDGAGSIVWSHCQGEPLAMVFSMTGMPRDPAADAMTTTGVCATDFVMIMSQTTAADATAVPPTTAKMDDRYCGNGLTEKSPHMIRSVAKPFIMRVKTDSTEPTTDMANTGFCLMFRQEPPRQAGSGGK